MGDVLSTNASTATSQIATNIAVSVNKSCGSNNLTSASITGVQLDVSNIKCNNINLLTQQVQQNTDCAMGATTSAIADGVANQLQSAQKQAGKPVTMNLFDTNISSSDTDVKTTIKRAIKSKCGDNNTVASVFKNVSVDMSNVSCNNLNVLTQQSSVQTVCSLKGVQSAMTANPHVASAPVPGSSNSHMALYIAIAVGAVGVLGLIIGVIVYAVRRRAAVANTDHAMQGVNQGLQKLLAVTRGGKKPSSPLRHK